VALAREMLALAGQPDADVEKALRTDAMDAWREMIRAQDGDPTRAPDPRETHTVVAPSTGSHADGGAPVRHRRLASRRGRARAQDPVIHAAGIDLHVKPGDPSSPRVSRCSPCGG
jgi:thymidine phosphorylase